MPTNPKLLKKAQKHKKDYEDLPKDEEVDAEEAREGEEDEESDDKKYKFVTGVEDHPGRPVLGKKYKLAMQVVEDKATIGEDGTTTADPHRSAAFKSCHERAVQSHQTTPKHHKGLHNFHKTAKKVMEANYPTPEHKQATIEMIKNRWLGGK